MKNYYLLLCIFLLQCQPKTEKNYLQLLQGDWVNDKFAFCIWSSLGSFSKYGSFQKLYLKNDTLSIDVENTPENLLFKIQKIDYDSLILLPLDVFTKKKIDVDTSAKSIVLRKLKNQWIDNEEIVNVSFAFSGRCCGICPSFDLEVNVNGKGYYYGEINEESEPNYFEFKMDSIMITHLFKRIKQVSKKFLTLNEPHEVTYNRLYLVIKLKNKQKLIAQFDEPEVETSELAILLRYFSKIPNLIPLKQTEELYNSEASHLELYSKIKGFSYQSKKNAKFGLCN